MKKGRKIGILMENLKFMSRWKRLNPLFCFEFLSIFLFFFLKNGKLMQMSLIKENV